MPRLREHNDGTFYIRVYRGKARDTDQERYGTWQIYGKGLDRLRELNICHDGDDIPMWVFEELRRDGLIWTETGELGSRGRAHKPVRGRPAWTGATSSRDDPVTGKRSSAFVTVAPRPLNVTRARMPAAPVPAPTATVRSIPLDIFLEFDRKSWGLFVKLDRHRSQWYDAEWFSRLARQSPPVSICIERHVVEFQPGNAAKRLEDLRLAVPMSSRDYTARLRWCDGGVLSEQTVATIRGLWSNGTIFSSSGRRVRDDDVLSWNTTYYLLVNENLRECWVPPQCLPRRFESRQGWTLYVLCMPGREDQRVVRFVHDLGYRIA